MSIITVLLLFVVAAFSLAHALDLFLDGPEEEEEEPITLRSADNITASFEDEGERK